ncbi:MAG: hypothetical protein CTY18_09605 [Methylomonas sp.]|nr:MAG: hypothetical protein CTY18_09605 [Methylomonas sp.]
MSKKLPLILILLLLLTACAHQPNTPLKIQALNQLPALAAEFETTVIESADNGDDKQQHTYRWRFWRAANRVETLNLQDNSGEVWSQSANGQIEYQQVFHDQQQVLNYVPGDLKALGSDLDWSALATLLNQTMVASLLAEGREQLLGRQAMHYQSKIPESPLEITWLEHEQLPAMIKRTEHGHIIITRLTAIYPLQQSPWPYQRSGNYRYTDFADIGDKENDPFIQSIQHKISGGHSHGN